MSAPETLNEISSELSDKFLNNVDNIKRKPGTEIFEFLEQHFNKLYESENLNAVLLVLHRMFDDSNSIDDDISKALMCFLNQHKNNEKDLNISVQIIFQVLNSTKRFENKEIITNEVFVELIKLLPTIKNRKLLSGVVACLQFYVNNCPNNIVIMLWSDLYRRLQTKTSCLLTNDTDIDILIQLFDEFFKINPKLHEDATIVATIQQLLQSDQRSDRKCGYYLFKKILNCFVISSKDISVWLTLDECQSIEQSWTLYITILENLEENQSHLILPSLKNLDELNKSKRLQSSWLDILYIRILTHKNNLVLRWAVEFFLQTFKCSDLTTGIVKHLLEASNTNLLYNYESYFLNLEYMSSFLKGDLINIYTLIGDINWKSIPLYIWLEKLSERGLPNTITYEVILKISSRVRALQNCAIRKNTILLCNKIFEHFIDDMSWEEYAKYVETLYNSSDGYKEYEIIYNKKSSLIKAKNFVFNQKFFEIIGNEFFQKMTKINIKTFIELLCEIPKEQHGFLRFLPYHSEEFYDTQLRKLIANLYNLDFDRLINMPLSSIISEFEKCLLEPGLLDKQQIKHCRLAAISFYIYNLITLNNVEDETFRIIFNSELSENKVCQLSFCLPYTSNQLSTWILDEFVNRINNEIIARKVYEYLSKIKNDQYSTIIFEKYPQYMPFINTLNSPNPTCFFYGDVKKGESRIEQLFSFHKFDEYNTPLYKLKQRWLKAIEVYGDSQYVLYLLKCHRELTKQKPRYFENSNEHRFKLRIAVGILHAYIYNRINCILVLDEIWNILINENNQLNISYIYEYILGTYETRTDVILGKLNEAHNLTSSQQVSIIAVAYTFCMNESMPPIKNNILISDLLSLTMGANFQTRLFAQMTLFMLLKSSNFKAVSNRHQIIKSIARATGDKFTDYLNDIRIHMYNIKNWKVTMFTETPIAHIILFITNAPFDEIISPNFKVCHLSCPLVQNQVNKCREIFLKKTKITFEEDVSSNNDVNDQLQRKMNPVNDVTEHNNLIVYPIKEKSTEMFVIASLIDKLPNLGGIARTCEVLGINNLVMDSKKHTEKPEFKNLSMTAENSLNIIEVKPKNLKEFLMNKQLQGFKIVGAEQTSNSQNFENFKFPKKCILLLGHEKDGIPAPLLSILDYAVEIPQFGQVRSLNVHVTGALFMWEFCKQHLI